MENLAKLLWIPEENFQVYAFRGEFPGTWLFMITNDLNSSEIHKYPYGLNTEVQSKIEDRNPVSPHSSPDLEVFCNLGASSAR
jgi:hypothetical protein